MACIDNNVTLQSLHICTWLQVSLGVIPKNENKNDEMTAILEDLQKYVPQDSTKKPITIGFGGDQLTAERIRQCQLLRKHSFKTHDQLDGFTPFASDWHAEANLLQVHVN